MIKTILLVGIFSGVVEPPRAAAPWCYWLWENSHVDAETGDDRYRYYSRPFGKSLCHAWSAAPVFLVPWLDGGKEMEPLGDPPVVHSMLTRQPGVNKECKVRCAVGRPR